MPTTRRFKPFDQPLLITLTALTAVTASWIGLSPTSAQAGQHGGITYEDVATPGNGIDYRRAESPRDVIFDALKGLPVYTMADIAITPIKSRGAPGVALSDFDGDGDLDIYVTNGPGAANSLYLNQLEESGQVTFVDVALAAGVDASAQDSSGVCVGDTDNDGDPDLYVLGTGEANRFYENLGDGTFLEKTLASDIDGGERYATTCSMGDVDGDGLLDIVVGNTYDSWDNQLAIFVEPYAFNQHNQLFLNTGDNLFVDVSADSGIEDTRGFVPANDGAATITWSIALVDYDQDGDLDIVHADDQAAVPQAERGGVDRGLIHLLQNDGDGMFSDVTEGAGTDVQGQWMGLTFGDVNCDGEMDIFGSNIGDYMFTALDPSYQLGSSSSRWFLGAGGGTFDDPGVGPDPASVFGWGAGATDYDNDGDYDLIYHGGLDVGPFVEASNAGVVMQNQACSANFIYDPDATSPTNHRRRNVQGVALGDLDGDGFTDVVSVSNFDHPDPLPLVPYDAQYGSVFDDARLVPVFAPTGPGEFEFTGIELPDGTLAIELSSGNSNNWVKVKTRGTVGLTSEGRVNRDGVGTIVRFKPLWGPESMRPIVAGSSYASTHALDAGFGLGWSPKGTLDIQWPGGTHNRLYNVNAGETVTMPEIPCSYRDDWDSFYGYRQCVLGSLEELLYAGEVDLLWAWRLASSAQLAYWQFHYFN